MLIQRTTLIVSLTPELEQFITARVVTGLYQTASEVVRAALPLLEQSESRDSALMRSSATVAPCGEERA